jgi:hypothetical protein
VIVSQGLRGIARAAAISVFVVLAQAGHTYAAPWSQILNAAQFARSNLPRPGDADAIRRGGTLSGGEKDWGIVGWVEYDFQVPRDGWYQVFALPLGADTEFLLDADTSESIYYYGTGGRIGETEKIGNAWLRSGAHRLRAQRYYWTGFPRISALEIRESADAAAQSFRAYLPGDRQLFRARECPLLRVQVGGGNRAASLQVVVDAAGGAIVAQTQVTAPPGASIIRTVTLPCAKEGHFVVSFAGPEGRYPWPVAKPIDYEVIEVQGHAQSAVAKPVLVQEIDCVSQAPDYFGGDETRIAKSPAGSYRESGDRGYTRWQRLPESARKLLAEPGWFAYRLGPLDPQKRYVVEVDYPDDALRTFAMALRERAPLAYPLAGGADSGGALPLSNRMQTRQMTFWPRTSDPRLVFLNVHDGRRAAAAKIRVFRADNTSAANPSNGRMFMNWYEEGENFFSLYGASDHWYEAPRAAVDRWTASLAETGGNVLAPTVGVYGFSLYPSRFMRVFSGPDHDLVQRMLLDAEKYGMQVLPELHPRGDDVDLDFASAPDPKPNLLVSRDGRTNFYAGDGRTRNYPPLHNPLYPQNRAWYLGLIEELVRRYSDSPALLGVSLRLMPWANSSFNNFHSLDWGYDDYSIGLFVHETSTAVPMGKEDDPQRFAQRQRWIASNAGERWIEWRCNKISTLYAEIRDRLRAIRPDLILYTTVFPWQDRPDTRRAWREAGVDLRRIAAIEGVVVVDADQGFGRREADAEFERRQRAALLDPANLGMQDSDARAFLTSAYYLEATDAVVLPEAIGFPANTKRTWMSAVAIPAGRNVLEPYATQLASADANMLGVGGNGYTLGDPILSGFLAEYRALPREPFILRSPTKAVVVVRELVRGNEVFIYAVNRTAARVRLDLRLTERARIQRLRDGSVLAADTDRIALELDGFELVTLLTAGKARIQQTLSDILP